MKKLLPLFCASVLALTLAACGAQQTAQTDIEDAVALTFTNSGITAQDGTAGCEIDGTALTITESGTYAVSGSCADGSIQIKKGTTGVTLILNGLDLTSEKTAAITCAKSTEVTILAFDGTENALSDTEQNNDETYPDNADAENAVIKCKDGSTVTFGGTGALTVTANGKNGIKSGTTTDEDGEASLTIQNLTLTIDAPVNDAINAEQLLNIESGTLTIDAADDAVHSDLVLNVGAEGSDGPTIDITGCYEGLEAAELNIYSGDIDITATDDCLNAANSDLSGYDFTMTIAGGTINAYTSGGDGFDSNGDMTITGGTIAVWTANTADNEPLDADGTITVTGGTVLAAGGSAGMGMSLEATQPCVIFSLSGGMGGFRGGPNGTQNSADDAQAAVSNIAKGATLDIRNADGSSLYSAEAPCTINYVFFSSPDLTADENDTLCSGEETVATETAQTGTVSTGMSGMGAFPGGQRPNGEQQDGQPGEPPEGFGDQMPEGERPELPNGEVPEMPGGERPDFSGGERPEPPSGQGRPEAGSAPADSGASGTDNVDTTPTA